MLCGDEPYVAKEIYFHVLKIFYVLVTVVQEVFLFFYLLYYRRRFARRSLLPKKYYEVSPRFRSQFKMAVESTPKRDSFKVSLVDVFDDVTPMRENNYKKKKKKCAHKGGKRDHTRSSDESDAEVVMGSQVHKKRRNKERENKADKRMPFTRNCRQNISDDLIEEDENFYVNVKSQSFNSKIKFLDGSVDNLLLNVKFDSGNEVEIINSSSKTLNSKLFKGELKNGCCVASNVLKCSEKSLMPQENDSYFSNLIKKKLLENANNKEVIKSQTSGWTQYEFIDDQTSPFTEIESFYGLPWRVRELYEEHKGIKELYAWQQECLKLEAIKLKKNLVYTLPTSGGKSLVAEILILREILLYKKNVLFILPFVSIVQEKIRDFSQFSLEFGFSVEEYAAGKGAVPPKKHRRRLSLMVATIEKALIVVNSLIETGRLQELGLVVVDELHLLSEEGRGPTLEMLLVQVMHCADNIQVVGMTATIGNLEEVATFLGAESYAGNFRPVRLTEYLKCENKIYAITAGSGELVKEFRTLDSQNEEDADGIARLVEEIIPDDAALIFCPTKTNCENVALLLSRLLSRNIREHKEEEKSSLCQALVSETNGRICPTLKKTIPFGIAYHHSGLTAGERKLLEEAFRQGTLCVICCTSTLAVGVNLPAKRVILRSPYIGRDFISLSKYKQMVGRAGRAGFGSEGESYLVCRSMELKKVKELFNSQMDEAMSKLGTESCKSMVLSAVGLGTAATKEELKKLSNRTLLHHQFKKLKVNTEKMVDDCIESLCQQGALNYVASNSVPLSPAEGRVNAAEAREERKKSGKFPEDAKDCQLTTSRLGRAAMKGGLSIETAHELYEELVKAQGGLVLLTNLHLLYLVTPHDLSPQIKPNFSILFNIYMQFDSKEVRTAAAIGITEFVVSKLAVGVHPKNVKGAVLNRFYICLILNELWKQRAIWDVATLFQLPRGLVQTVMTSAATFANCVLRFCEELKEFWSFKALLTDFAPRLAHCCAPELLPLMDLPAVKRGRAKQLYDAGFKSLDILASAEPKELVRAVAYMPHKIAAQIVAAAKMLLMEKAESLKEEAEDVLESLKQKNVPPLLPR